MLWVYAGVDLLSAHHRALTDLPKGFVDLSKLSSDKLSSALTDFCDHHRTGHLFLGFLDPLLMLHPIEETLLRRGFAHCDVSILVSNPYLLPLSWKNGIQKLVIVGPINANSYTAQAIDDGGSSHIQDEVKHRQTFGGAADQRNTHQGGKEGSPPKRRKQARQNQAPKS